MCSDDIPRGVIGLPEPSRRRFLRHAGITGGVATAAAALAACTDDTRLARSDVHLHPEDAIVNDTYTGLSERDRSLTIRQLIENTDASAPDDQIRGTHRIVWDVATTQPYVALTVDDGPDPRWTPQVLDALAAVGAKATFFMMGWNVQQHTDLARRIVAEGHDVGNHTWSHQDLAFEDPPSARHEIIDCKRILADELGVRSTYFRPPRGELSGAAMRIVAEQNYDTFLWSVSRNDAGIGTPTAVADHVAARLRPGAIVDMHDSIGRGLFLPASDPIVKLLAAKRDVDAAAVPEILRRGIDAGLRFVTVSELLGSASNPAALSPALPPPAGAPTGPTTTAPTGTPT
jgi:peptidoglycan/xylan/chitin deacetylase (PgdA/CDA1 family)